MIEQSGYLIAKSSKRYHDHHRNEEKQEPILGLILPVFIHPE
jgi:hypothetical protein